MQQCLLLGLTFTISVTFAADFEIDLPKLRAERDAAKARKDAAEAVIRAPRIRVHLKSGEVIEALKSRLDADQQILTLPDRSKQVVSIEAINGIEQLIDDAAVKQATTDRLMHCMETARLTEIIRREEMALESAARRKINDRKLCDEYAGESIRFYNHLGLQKDGCVPGKEAQAKMSDKDFEEWSAKIRNYLRHFPPVTKDKDP